MEKTNLTELPADVILLIFPYLTACDFLSFTSCTKRLLSFRQEPTFWRVLTTQTFRIPSQPLLRSDGARWQWLYKSLLTQTHVYTWGNNKRGNLGHSYNHLTNPHRFTRPRHQGWPTEMEEMNRVGVVADVQCGGWSTVLLNSLGQLFLCGIADGEKPEREFRKPGLLGFPPGYPPTTRDRYEPDTAVKQYSVGRSRVMGLSDSGKMWEWANGGKPGLLVKLVSVDVAEGAKFGKGRVTRVVSGWAGSSAYINGVGIVFWDRMPEQGESLLMDACLMESFTVPGTSFKRNQTDQHSRSSLECRIGEVLNHVVLENSIVFITHLDKVFAYPFSYNLKPGSTPVELTTFRQPSPSFRIEDIHGSFRNFGIFSRDGAVLLGTTTLISTFIDASLHPRDSTFQARNSEPTTPLPQPFLSPVLQRTSVISLAFGDYHYHALHADGTITSHGTDLRSCGALGLGPRHIGPLRGVHYGHSDGMILKPSPQTPPLQSPASDRTASLRTIWFEPEKMRWLEHLHANSATADVFWQRNRMNDAPPEFTQTYADWFEREGRAWHLGPPERRPRTEPSLSDPISIGTGPSGDKDEHPDKGAYFAVKIAAAGWHSAALILVDPAKAERVRNKYLLSSPAPTTAPSANVDNEETTPIASPPASSEPTAASPNSSSSSTLNLRGLGASLHQTGRHFLGLTARDEMRAAADEEGARAITERQAQDLDYVWEDSLLPRLRGPNGSVLPGTGEVAGWTVEGRVGE